MAKFAKNAPAHFKKAVIMKQFSRLSDKDKKEYIKNMWPEDKKLIKTVK